MAPQRPRITLTADDVVVRRGHPDRAGHQLAEQGTTFRDSTGRRNGAGTTEFVAVQCIRDDGGNCPMEVLLRTTLLERIARRAARDLG